jgi:hypothetical protein
MNVSHVAVNTKGADLSQFAPGEGRALNQLEGKVEADGLVSAGGGLSVTSGGANATPEESKPAPVKVDASELDTGAKVDPNTGAYRRATYMIKGHQTGCQIIRQDR